MINNLLKNSAAIFSFQVINRGLAFLSFVFLARILGIEGIGNYAYIISLCAMLTLFVEFGTNQFLVKRVAAENGEVYDKDILNIILVKIIQFGCGLLLLGIFEYRFIVKDFHFLNLTFFYIIFESIAQTGISVLNGRKEFIRANTYSFFYETGRSLGLLVLLFIFRSVNAVPVIYILAAFVYALVVTFKVIGEPRTYAGSRSVMGSLSWSTLAGYYKNTYLFFVSAIAFQLYFRIDMILLKRLSTIVELGVYGTAYKFFEVFLFIPAIISGLVFPQVAGLYKNDPGQVKGYLADVQLKAVSLLSFGVILMIISSNFIIHLFFGEGYMASVEIMQLLFLTSFLFCFNFIYTVLFNATGNEKYTIYVFIFGFAVNFLLNYFFIPLYGARAAAIATFIAEAIVTVLYFLYLQRKGLQVINPRALLVLLYSLCISFLFISLGHSAFSSIFVLGLLAGHTALLFFIFRKEIKLRLQPNA